MLASPGTSSPAAAAVATANAATPTSPSRPSPAGSAPATAASPATASSPSTTQTKFCLKWNNFGLNVTRSFSSLLERGELVDLSLSCAAAGSTRRRTLRAHQVVLSASSQYFREMLRELPPGQQPVFLLDVPFADLECIVHFIYNGEVSVDQEQLPSFLKTAQMLRVKGLTEEHSQCAPTTATTATTSGFGDDFAASQKPRNGATASSEEDVDGLGDDEEEEEEQPVNAPPTEPLIPPIHSGPFGGFLPKALLGLQHPLAQTPSGHVPAHRSRKNLNPKRTAPKSPDKVPTKIRRDSGSEETHEEEEEEGPEESGVFAGEIDDREEEEIAAVQQAAMQMQQQHQQAHAVATATLLKQFMTSSANDTGGQVTNVDESLPMIGQENHQAVFPLAPGLDPDTLTAAFPTLKHLKMAGGGAPGLSLVDPSVSPGAASTASSIPSASGNGGGSSSSSSSSLKKTCPYCFQQLSWHALSRHIRDMHKSKTTFVTCKHCLKVFRNKNSLGCHMWRFHKDSAKKGDDASKEQKQQQQQKDDAAAALMKANA